MMGDIFKCRACGALIVWLKTYRGKNIPVDVDTYNGEEIFDRTKHRTHFETCPEAKQFRKNKQEKK